MTIKFINKIVTEYKRPPRGGEKMLELNALKIVQSGWRKYERKDVELYVTTMSAKDLLNEDIVRVDRWDPEKNPEGYQRPLARYRPREISRYLTDEAGLFPTSILLNARGEIKFEQQEENGIGKLIIPPESLPLWLVDGQHRVVGLRHCIKQGFTEFLDYQLPVVIMNLDRFGEVTMFYIVNKRQKGVPVDVAERNLREIFKTRPELEEVEPRHLVSAAKVLDITEYLNNDPESPFYDKIYYTLSQRKGRLVKESIMSRAIGKMFDKNEFFITEDRDKIKEFLKNYWNAVKELYPLAFGNNDEYNLTRSQGIRAMTYLAGMVYDECRRENNFTYEKIRSILERLKEGDDPVDDAWWHREKGSEITQATNERAVEVLYRELLERIRR